jgi:hypothetical protein
MNIEGNVPAWYSSMAMMLCAALLGVAAVHKLSVKDRFARHWAGLCLVFVYMSADEAAAFHEKLGALAGVLVSEGGAVAYAGLLPGSLLVLAVGLSFLGFLRHLPARTRWLFVIAGCAFVSAVLFVEALSYGILGDSRIVRMGIVVIEETMEMVAIAVFALAILDYLRTHVREITLRFE